MLNKRLNYLINFKIKLITSRIINTNHKYLGALTSLLLLILRLIPVKISAKERVDWSNSFINFYFFKNSFAEKTGIKLFLKSFLFLVIITWRLLSNAV